MNHILGNQYLLEYLRYQNVGEVYLPTYVKNSFLDRKLRGDPDWTYRQLAEFVLHCHFTYVVRVCAMSRQQALLRVQVPPSVWRAMRVVVCRLFLVDHSSLGEDLAKSLPRVANSCTRSAKRASRVIRNDMLLQHQYTKMLTNMRFPVF